MTQILLLAGLLALIGFLSMYLVAPLRVWRSSATRVTRSRPLGPNDAGPEVRGLVRELAATVQPLGYELREVSDLNDGMALALHAYNPATRAHLVDYQMAQYRWQVFRTEFADGQEVVTANAPLPSVFTRPATLHACALPAGTDLVAVHHAHEAHVDLRASGAEPVPGQATGYVEHHERRGMEAQVGFGLYRRIGEEYRPTLRGAFLTTWRLLPPLKQMRAAENDRVLRALLSGP